MFLELRCTERIVKHCVVHIEIVRIRINRILGAKFRFGDRKSGQIMKVESGRGGEVTGIYFQANAASYHEGHYEKFICGRIGQAGFQFDGVRLPMEESIEQQGELPLVLRAAYMALHRRTEAAFDKYGVTADQFVLMLSLRDSGTLTQRELADRLSSDASTVRAMLVLLERRGFVQRASHPTDSRAKTVQLTSAGKKKLRQLWKVSQKIRDEMYEAMTVRETEALIGLLRRVAGILSRAKVQV